jgi:hypothetical protein
VFSISAYTQNEHMKLIFFLLLSLQTLPAENAAGPMYVKAAKEGDIKTIETLFSIGFSAN